MIGLVGYSLQLIMGLAALYLITLGLPREAITSFSPLQQNILTTRYIPISVINVASASLAYLAWLLAGIDVRRKLFITLGILGMASILAGGAAVVLIQQMTVPPTARPVEKLLPIIIFSLVMGGLALATKILELISFFSAARQFGASIFKYAGIAGVIALVVAILLPTSAAFILLAAGRSAISGFLSLVLPTIFVVVSAAYSVFYMLAAYAFIGLRRVV